MKRAPSRVTFLGKMEVRNGIESHMLSVKKCREDCESCHTSDSNFFKTVTVAIVKADGRLKEYKVQPEVLGSMMSLASLKQFYVLGSTRLKILDWIGIVMVFGGISVPVLHIAFRILTSPIREAKRLNRMRKGTDNETDISASTSNKDMALAQCRQFFDSDRYRAPDPVS